MNQPAKIHILRNNLMSKIANDDLKRNYLSSWHEGVNHWKKPLLG